MKIVGKFLFYAIGWKIVGSIPDSIKKCVIIAAPHTSNWDFYVGRIAYWALGVPVKFLIKKEAFDNPLGGLLVKMGGIPVDRKKSTNLVDQVASLFNHHEILNIVVAPEGTRKLSKNWKKGYYFIALKAKVPMVLGFVDYKNKEGGFGPIIYPSGDYEKDILQIEAFYKTKTARHPENFNLSPQNLNAE
jgi:1-acyl-sn-glycerol-3-phosphate acyltransferase